MIDIWVDRDQILESQQSVLQEEKPKTLQSSMRHCHSCDLIKQNTHYKLKMGNCREKRNNITFISDHNLALESILKNLKPTLVYECVMYLPCLCIRCGLVVRFWPRKVKDS